MDPERVARSRSLCRRECILTAPFWDEASCDLLRNYVAQRGRKEGDGIGAGYRGPGRGCFDAAAVHGMRSAPVSLSRSREKLNRGPVLFPVCLAANGGEDPGALSSRNDPSPTNYHSSGIVCAPSPPSPLGPIDAWLRLILMSTRAFPRRLHVVVI